MPPSSPESPRPRLLIGAALRLVWSSGPKWTIAQGGLVLVQGLLPLASLYLTKLVVDAVAAGVSTPDRDAAWDRILWLLGLVAGVALLSAVCRFLASLVSEAQALVVGDRIAEVLHAKSVSVDLEYYENPKFYDKLHRAQGEAPFRALSIASRLFGGAQAALSLFGLAALLVAFHWGLALVLVFAALPGAWVRKRFAERLYGWTRERTETERKATYLGGLLTGSQHAKEVRLFELGPSLIRRYRALRRELRRERLGLAARHMLTGTLAEALSVGIIYGSYGYIAWRTFEGTSTIGDLIMYFQAIQRAQGAFQQVLGSVTGLYEDNLFLSNFTEFLAVPNRVREPATPRPVSRPVQEGLRLEGVGFRYPASAQPALDDVSFAVRPGECVALVGENGAGKTSLVKLLCRLYDPTAGRITLDGHELGAFATTDLRRNIGVLFQDYARYDVTARENIHFGNVTLPASDHGTIEQAARRAGAHELISRLPKGYDTVLGRWFEGGAELSIGEWQKVALARAWVRDAQILILDEPTAALDPRAEQEVFDRFREMARDRMCILVSHRFSSVRQTDRIFVLSRGRLVESGPHEELLALRGTYARLFEAQARGFQ